MFGLFLLIVCSCFFIFFLGFGILFRLLGLINHFKQFTIKRLSFSAGFWRLSPIRVRPDSDGRPKSEFGRIRAAVPNLSSAGFGRPSQIRVRPDSDGRAGSAGFGRRAERIIQCQVFLFFHPKHKLLLRKNNEKGPKS